MPQLQSSLDPLLTLAIAMHNTRGGYAVLLGSGVSRAAGIPTGWEVVEDLIRRLAALEGQLAAAAVDPAAWYTMRFGEPPAYSRLTEQLAGTPTERRELLRRYFEPTEDERANGLKVPTAAHRALARLMRDGIVRIVLTTNFDQLLETALRDEGITPAVVSSPDAVAGMMPLHLAPATVIKLHGDYLDIRIKNTPDELVQYDPAMNRLLDRVIDEYGLVVCGWSAAWDDALRDAIMRCPNRRFTTFWAAHGDLSPEARQLIEQRQAQVIEIETADAFFDSVAEKVATLESLGRPHPLSTAVAVATLKRYLPVSEQRIRLHDLIDEEVSRTIERTIPLIPTETAPTSVADALSRLPKIEAASATVMALLATGGYWGEAEHRSVWVRAIERLGNIGTATVRRSGIHYPIWDRLLRYPAQLAFYAAGLGALARGTQAEETLADVLLAPRLQLDVNEPNVSPVWGLNLSEAVEHDVAKQLPGVGQRWIPMSDQLVEVLRPVIRPILSDEGAYEDLFDRFEYLIALAYGDMRLRRTNLGFWAPVGRLSWRRRSSYGGPSVVDEVTAEIQAAGTNWFLLRRGLFDKSLERVAEVQALVNKGLNNYGRF